VPKLLHSNQFPKMSLKLRKMARSWSITNWYVKIATDE